MRNFGVIYIATLVILTLVIVGCGEEEVATYKNEEEELSSQPEDEDHDAEEIDRGTPEPALPLAI